MKYTLEFTLPDDRAEMYTALESMNMLSTLSDVDNLLRGQLKHGNEDRDRAVMEEARRLISDVLRKFAL